METVSSNSHGWHKKRHNHRGFAIDCGGETTLVNPRWLLRSMDYWSPALLGRASPWDSTMKIAALTPYRAIPAFGPVELPALTVLTGLNGSGKSQLLTGLYQQDIACDLFRDLSSPQPGAGVNRYKSGAPQSSQITLLRHSVEPDDQFTSNRPSKLAERFGFQAQDPKSATFPAYNFDAKRTELLAPAREKLDELVENLDQILAPGEDPWQLGPAEIIRRANIDVFNESEHKIRDVFIQASNSLKMTAYGSDPMLSSILAEIRQAASEFNISNLHVTRQMMDNLRTRISVQMFQPNVVEVFGAYRDRLVANDLDELQSRRDPSKTFLDQRKFLDIYGPPPWELVTGLLTAMGLPFEVVEPSHEMQQPVSFRLRRRGRTEELAFTELSSGEQVLLRFALSVMQPNPAVAGLQRPSLLLLDEMDASLHPEMTQRWLSAIEKGIVGELGIKVIITTHSPTTVALAPPESIFAMINGVPTPISKQEAVNKLTFGVPTLSIDYSGRRQVFCESSNDAAIYEKIYAAIKPRLKLYKELNFIGTGIRDKSKSIVNGEGEEINAGEAVVQKIVKSLSSLNVDTVFGLIDWDKKAKETDRIKVVGAGTHYTIENILLDPFLIGALMIYEGLPVKGFNTNRRELASLTPAAMQSIADRVQNSFEIPEDDGTLIRMSYLGGTSINIRKRYASFNGHNLETLLIDTFNPLKRFTGGRGALPRKIAELLINDYPEFCPIIISQEFEKLSFVQVGSCE